LFDKVFIFESVILFFVRFLQEIQDDIINRISMNFGFFI
jgi:hypothetical protein